MVYKLKGREISNNFLNGWIKESKLSAVEMVLPKCWIKFFKGILQT